MESPFKTLRRLLFTMAVCAVSFGFVHAPMTVLAMHQEMEHGAEVQGSFNHISMNGSSHEMVVHSEDDCSESECFPISACLRHCLQQASSRHLDSAPIQRVDLHVPAVLSQRIIYPAEEDELVYSDHFFSHTGLRDTLLTTHKRE